MMGICRWSIGLWLLLLPCALSAAPHVVTNTADSGPGSLRQAIDDANTVPGTISFNIPGAGPHTISVQTPLPSIQQGILIEGFTQPGSQASSLPITVGNDAVLKIVIDGTLAGMNANGLTFESDGFIVSGLVIQNFSGAGIYVAAPGSAGFTILNNYIGTDVTGKVPRPNKDGVYIQSTPSGQVIGNIISGNQMLGVRLDGDQTTNSVVLGNYIGTDNTGKQALPNGEGGVLIIEANHNTIGAALAFGQPTYEMANLISGHLGIAVYLSGPDTTNNLVEGNYIGVDITGTNALPNVVGVQIDGGSDNDIIRNIISGNFGLGITINVVGSERNRIQANRIGTDVSGFLGIGNGAIGIALSGAANTVIGGVGHLLCCSEVSQGNLISANGNYGIAMSGLSVTGTMIEGNLIGVNANREPLLGNIFDGIRLDDDVHGTSIGGLNSSAGNVIAGNNKGIVISAAAGAGNSILGNSIFSNDRLGIDLGDDDVTPNDPGDADTGVNDQQNYPVLVSAETVAGVTTVHGSLDSLPNHNYRLEFFASPAPEMFGFDEGKVLLGVRNVSTDNNGQAAVLFQPASPVQAGWTVTATATDEGGSTSEFSSSVQVQAAVDPNSLFRWVTPVDSDVAAINDVVAVAADTNGYSYVAGEFTGNAFLGGAYLTSAGGFDLYLAKLDPEGNYVWVRQMGGADAEQAWTLVLGPDGALYLSGAFSDIATFSQTNLTSQGSLDIFLAKYDTDGALLWVRQAGGSQIDQGRTVAVSASGSIFLGGSFGGMAHFEALPLTASGPSDGFLAKLDANGHFQWIRGVAGAGVEFIANVALGTNGNPIVVGSYDGPITITTNAFGNAGDFDSFVAEFNQVSSLVWLTKIAGPEAQTAQSVAVAPNGSIFVTGSFAGATSFAPSNSVAGSTAGSRDMFLARYTPSGALQWLRTGGGDGYDEGYHVAVDSAGRAYVVGSFSSVAAFDNKQAASIGDLDAFMAAYDSDGDILVLEQAGGAGEDAGIGIALASGGRVIISGYYSPPEAFFGPFTLATAAIYNGFQAALDVSPPQTLIGPVSQSVDAGSILALDAVVTGAGLFRYQWLFNGVPITDATNAAFVLSNPQLADSGMYAVRVTNPFGTATSSAAAITVIPHVSFLQQPVSTNVFTGQPVQLCVMAAGPSPAYQWRHNGVNIPGATSACFDIPSTQLQDQGTYDVLITDGGVTIASDAAHVELLDLPRPEPGDNFTNRISIVGNTGAVGGSNTNATREANEPFHAGKFGNKSVWFNWVAPANGIATFSTAGSSFDTLLAVYVGLGIDTLQTIASDEDRGGSLTSTVQFNATSGQAYRIALDGFAGAAGDYVLSWQFTATANRLPVILLPPSSASVRPGSNVTFRVTASGTSLAYQWFFRGVPIAGQTQDTLTVLNAGSAQVGPYFVRVSSGLASVDSAVVVLEIGNNPGFFSVDKPQDLFPLSGQGGGSHQAASDEEAVGEGGGLVGSGFVPVAAGAVGSHVMANTGASTSLNEPTPGGAIGGSSQWFGLLPAEDGILVVDTIDSTIDTLLAVYSGPSEYSDSLLFQLALVGSDDNGAPDGVRSRVCIPADAGTNYYVRVDGIGGGTGTIQLHWTLLHAGVLESAADRQLLVAGKHFVLSMPTAPGIRFQWQQNGTNVVGAVSSSLALCNLALERAGDYRLVTIDTARSQLSSSFPIAVGQFVFGWTQQGGGRVFNLTGRASHDVAIDQSGLINQGWTTVMAGVPAQQPFHHSMSVPANTNSRGFVRVRLLNP